jgi:hypothetical protein
MNKYTVITFVVLTGIVLTILYLFDLEYRWWYAIPIYLLSKYNILWENF